MYPRPKIQTCHFFLEFHSLFNFQLINDWQNQNLLGYFQLNPRFLFFWNLNLHRLQSFFTNSDLFLKLSFSCFMFHQFQPLHFLTFICCLKFYSQVCVSLITIKSMNHLHLITKLNLYITRMVQLLWLYKIYI